MTPQNTILIVDDDPEVSAVVGEHLARDGHRIVIAQTLAAAAQRLRNEPIALVLLDLGLPDGNGLALLHDVPRLDEPPDFVIVTGHATLDSALIALNHGAAGYVTKPLDLAQLNELVAQIFERRRLRSENIRLHVALGEGGSESEALADMASAIRVTLSSVEEKLELPANAQGVSQDVAREVREARQAADRLVVLARELRQRLQSGADAIGAG